MPKSLSIDYKRFLIVFTILCQLRSLLDDSQFTWISIFTYTTLPEILTVYSSILVIKLYKQKHFPVKAFFCIRSKTSCKNIVEQHKGKISVKNNSTAFTIRIPRELSLAT